MLGVNCEFAKFSSSLHSKRAFPAMPGMSLSASSAGPGMEVRRDWRRALCAVTSPTISPWALKAFGAAGTTEMGAVKPTGLSASLSKRMRTERLVLPGGKGATSGASSNSDFVAASFPSIHTSAFPRIPRKASTPPSRCILANGSKEAENTLQGPPDRTRGVPGVTVAQVFMSLLSAFMRGSGLDANPGDAFHHRSMRCS